MVLLLPFIGTTQSNAIATTGKFGSKILLGDVNGRAFVNIYADINGSPYLFPNFKSTSIVLNDGRKYTNVPARLNLVEHEINFIASNQEQGFIGKGMAQSIELLDTNKQGVRTYIFQSGFPKIDNQSVIHFYQVLAQGKLLLLKSINKNIEERLNELSGEKSKEFAVRENLYLFTNGVIVRIKKDKAFFMPYFADQLTAMESYMSTQKVNFKQEDQLQKLINYYNSL